MALSTFVKINGVTNLTDARYGAGMYVNLLGFNLDRNSDKYISPVLFKEISGWVSGVDFVGEFSHEFQPDILEILKEYPAITCVEHDRIEELKALEGKGYSLIYRMNLEEVRQIELEVAKTLSDSGIYFHVISDQVNLAEEDLMVLENLAKNCRVILGTGITSENVKKLIADIRIYGISLSGSNEIKPGLSDMDQLAEVLEKLEVEE